MKFLQRHFHVLLYAGFWLSLVGYGLLAPPERLELLESSVLRQGWHIAVMAVFLGGSVLVLYARRMRVGAAVPPDDLDADEAGADPEGAS